MKIGDRVSGRYKIIGKVGAGGMANVYLATDLILERDVAVKMISLDFQDDKDSLRRFQREALSTAELTHPNIVNIYDVGEGNHPYIVMEHIVGMDLKQYIRENHPIPYHKTIDIMEQLLDGIAYAHENGVIHRDIKPHNILIDNEGHVKITDFGIAVALSQNSITQTNSLLGSVQYISPEQARGNMVTKQSDIYSLGIVLYELLTGTVPFDGESAVSIALKHFQSTIPSLRDSDSRLPQALENVVLKATSKEPKSRYATVNEMKEDLKTTLAPSRRSEEKFVPVDPNDEDTMVLDGATLAAEAALLADESNEETISLTDKDEKSATKKKKKRRWWLLLIPLILITVVLAYVLSQPVQVVVPDDLIGMTLDDATDRLEEDSLAVGEVIEQSNDEVEEGLVFRINPDAGATVLEDSEIDLYVSLGEEPFELEDYTGDEYEEVRARLTELGFEVESEEQSSEEFASGEIIQQDLAAGEEVIISETTITFTVSTGRPVILFRDLTEYSRASVDDYVTNTGLNLTAEEQSSEEIPLGLVISQDPAPKTTLHAGDRVKVIFSTGPEERTNIAFSRQILLPYNELREDPEDEESPLIPNEIKIYIDDFEKNIENIAHELSITADEQYFLNFVVEEGESATYRVVRDGETIEEETVTP